MLSRKSAAVREFLPLPLLACAMLSADLAQAGAAGVGPAAINAGPVAVTPTVGSEIKYRDNIYLQDTDEVGSWIYVLRPALNATVQDRNNLYQLDYQGETGWYEQSDSDNDNDYFDHTFSGDAHVELSQYWIAEGHLSWAQLHEDRGTGVSEGAIGNLFDEPVNYELSDLNGTVQYGAGDGAARLVLQAGYLQWQYQNFEEFTQTRDRDETTFGATFFYPVAPKTDIFAEYRYKDIAYPNAFVDQPKLDSEEHSAWAGLEWEITPNLTSTAKAAYVKKDFQGAGRDDWDGIGWSLELWMQPRDRDTIFVLGERAPEETSQQGDFILRESLMADWTHDWSDRVYTKLGVSVGSDSYRNAIIDREDDIYSASAQVGYQFRRWVKVYAGYSWDQKDSKIDNLDYTDHTFLVGLELSL